VKRSSTLGKKGGFALIEAMIAFGLFALIASSTLYAMVSSNRFVASQRYVSNAKALCQERIDEALVSSFPFASRTGPTFLTAPLPLPTTDTATPQLTESVPIYIVANAAQTAPSLVAGTRMTWVKSITVDGANFARVRVRVEFLVNGRGPNNKLWSSPGDPTFFCEMITLRAPD
jgi:type II secretory pathway pseudopilin PulG